MSEISSGDHLDEKFFQQSAVAGAPQLLGKQLCLRRKNQTLRWPITEVEAYDGFEDKASHAHRGATPRNRIMFKPGGNWYVYLCYGVHWLLNVTMGPEKYPAAVLIRGVGDVQGPGRLTKALGVNRHFHEKKIHPASGLWIEDIGTIIPETSIALTPRIGIESAGEPWVKKPWRFVWKDIPGVHMKV